MSNYSEEDMLTIIRSDGLVQAKKLTKTLNRSEFAIESFWKRYPNKKVGSFNGLPYEMIKDVYPLCPYLYTEVLGGLKLCLWADLELLPIDQVIHESIEVMAAFQRFIFKADHSTVRIKICQMINQHL
jgi:hypothetical protein